MAVAGPYTLAPSGSTGNNTHNAVFVDDTSAGFAAVVVVDAAGATPTVTFALQGSMDNVNWNTVGFFSSNTGSTTAPAVSLTTTVVGTNHAFSVPGMFFRYVRLVSSANTNITYHADLYLHEAA